VRFGLGVDQNRTRVVVEKTVHHLTNKPRLLVALVTLVVKLVLGTLLCYPVSDINDLTDHI